MTPVRIGIVGAGWWSTVVHMPALKADAQVEIVAVVDPSEERRAHAMETFGISHSFSELGELLALGGIDGVIIATPHHTHAALVEQSLRSGVSVLVEKPMGTTAEDVWRIVELERTGTAQVVVGLTYQFAACANAVRAAVQGLIGDLVSVNAEFSSLTASLFSVLEAPVDGPDRPGIPNGATYNNPATGGGQGYTQLSHLLGGLLWAAGDQAVEVSAFMDNRGVKVDVVDALSFRLAGGALCVASSTGTTPKGVPARHRIRFHGTLGMVEWDMLSAEAWVYQSEGRITHLTNPANRAAYAASEVAVQFARVVAGQADNPAPSDTAAASISLIEAAYIAASSGDRVAVVQGALRS